MSSLAIITVVYENYEILSDFFDSLKKQSNKNFHLFIIDSSQIKKTIQTDFPITVIPAENHGYAAGVNLGINEAQKQGYSLFCVINNDTYFKENFVELTLQSLQNNPHSIVGGKIYYAPGYEYHKDRYTPEELGKVIWYAGGEIDWNHAMTPHTGVDDVDEGLFNQIRKVTFVTGCLISFDSSVINTIGFWDPTYFLYYEDADFCARAAKKHINILYDPSIVIWHKVSQMTGGSGSELHQQYQNKNRVKFGLKYAPLRTKLHLLKNLLFEKMKTK